MDEARVSDNGQFFADVLLALLSQLSRMGGEEERGTKKENQNQACFFGG
jgi:hypothetical protein